MEEIDIAEILKVMWHKKIQIILIVVLFASLGVAYSYTMVVPKYRSSTSLVLATTNDDGSASSTITQADITMNQKLVSTYSELIKSKSVLRQVISNLDISSLSEENIRKNISVTSVSSTELIQITVANENKVYPSIIANEIAKVFTEKVGEIYNINNVHVVDEAEVPDGPYNINHTKDIMIFAAIGAVIAAAYVLIYSMLDNTIKTQEDVEKNAEMFVLAEIPQYSFDYKKGGKK